MDRKRLEVELKNKEKARATTFKKRVDNLFKKAYELSELCDVKLCMIICWPKQDGSFKLYTWPKIDRDVSETKQNLNYVRRIINKCRTSFHQSKIYSMSDSPQRNSSKINLEIVQLRKKLSKNDEYPWWDDRINNLSKHQLKELAANLDAKLRFVNRSIKMKRVNHYVMVKNTHKPEDESQSSHSIPDLTQDYLQGKEDMEATQQQSIPSVYPRNVQRVNYHPQQAMLEFNPDFVGSSMMKNYENHTQLGVIPANNIQYIPVTGMFNNCHPLMSYYVPTIKHMPPHMQYPAMPSFVPVMPLHMQNATMPSALQLMPPHDMQHMHPHMQHASISSSSHIHPSLDDVHKFYSNPANAKNQSPVS
ncbi:SRF-TF domain-containing protein [Cephalotus follicularis]|uniref:SRF-TF domain-containing protein n=1 Tax=Cephalotus follicularis TaxID=3775 RepID=A0A1Q3DCS7_CEPFO|nr:SRF-TF domain-containing protein [Cephalotus follicularis]